MMQRTQEPKEIENIEKTESNTSSFGAVRLLIDLVFLIFGIFYSPFFIKRLKQASSGSQLFKERMGRFSQALKEQLKGKSVLWIHAVSVGEVMSIEKLVKELLVSYPSTHLLITTVTPTGQSIAKAWESERVSVCYYPFDMTFAVKRFFKTVKPRLILLTETEIWPNFLLEAREQNVPVGIINARLSERSTKRYQSFSGIFKKLFGQMEFVLAQTEEDAKRFVQVGASESKVETFGNIKFDNVELSEVEKTSASEERRRWGLSDHDFVVMAGSTHPGEEEKILTAYKVFRAGKQDQKIILAPRHVDRVEQIVKIVKQAGFAFQRSSNFKPEKSFDVLIVDQMGILKNLYSVGDIVFMGGSLIKHGGQNPIEPACFKKPIIHGPYIFNFARVYQALQERNGVLRIEQASELSSALSRLFNRKEERVAMGDAAFALVASMQGATQKYVEFLSNRLTA